MVILMLNDDELWNKCNSNKAITSEDLGINNNEDALTMIPKANLIYTLKYLDPAITKIKTNILP